MDSMRSLNTSLPTPYSSRPVPPEHLLQAFKSAALSVTNLYKSAVQEQNNNRAAGYQDALDDLLRFLDSENLGLQDGEGWRIRQWLTERYDGTANEPSIVSEDEKIEVEQHSRDTVVEDQTLEPEVVPESAQVTEVTEQQERSPHQLNETTQLDQHEGQSTFQFRYPAEAGMRLQDDRETLSAPPLSSPVSDNEMSASTPARTQVGLGRGIRTSHRSSSNRQGPRSTTRNLGTVSGMKRKNPFPELNFFDVANLGPREGTDPSGKRGRHA